MHGEPKHLLKRAVRKFHDREFAEGLRELNEDRIEQKALDIRDEAEQKELDDWYDSIRSRRDDALEFAMFERDYADDFECFPDDANYG